MKKHKGITFALAIIAAVVLFGYLLFGSSEPANAEPTKPQILEFIESRAPEGMSIRDFEFAVFPASSSAGRISIEGRAQTSEIWLQRTTETPFHGLIRDAGISTDILYTAQQNNNRPRRISQILWLRTVAPSGVGFHFTGELTYTETVSGFTFRGPLDFASPKDLANYPPIESLSEVSKYIYPAGSIVVIGEPSFDLYVADILKQAENLQ